MAKIIAVLSIITDLDLKTDRISGQCLREFNAKCQTLCSMLNLFFQSDKLAECVKRTFHGKPLWEYSLKILNYCLL